MSITKRIDPPTRTDRPLRPLGRRFVTKVNGVTFADGYPATIQRLHELTMHDWVAGELEPIPAVLIRNPDNQIDPNAVEIHVPSVGGRIGHVPAVLAVRLAPEMDAGARFAAGITGCRIIPDHWDRPGIDVEIRRIDEEQ